MKNILGYYLMPHPPVIIPEVGKGEEKQIKNTIDSCKKVGNEVKENEPDTIVIITPHGVMFSDAIAISYDHEISGDLSKFRADSISLNKEIDIELADEIKKLVDEENISTVFVNSKILSKYKRKFELDHGSIVPLYFIEKEYSKYKLVHITYGLLKDIDLYRFGMKIKEAINRLNRKTVIIASGDLSHRLTEDGPYPYSPKGSEFDQTLISFLKKGEILSVFKIDKNIIEEAGECGLRSIYILLGAIDGGFAGELLSYEGPLGVGYGVMRFVPKDSKIDILSILQENEIEKTKNKLENSDEYVRLARKSLEYFYEHDEIMEVPADISNELLNQKAGVFVSLKKNGNLRGCIGTFLPTTNSIAEEIIRNAIEAAIDDPRFNRVSNFELDDLDISVDVLSKPINAKKEELDPKIYGVIVSANHKRGLLLPDIEGVNTVEEQLEIACKKAGISPKSHYDIQKFTVYRHLEGVKNE